MVLFDWQVVKMAERQTFDPGLIRIGELLMQKRKALGLPYQTRESFISRRSDELFSGEMWISLRHLSNIERGKNWPSIEKLLLLATALEENPVDLFEVIIQAYQTGK